ncbi:aminoglycoside phosphotransferase family protein [Micromonospora sp. C95]|uniref:aminoglycoside phosphotransferase family protein n=1 Tax=Micromonospora sp. C95 TaxID=2824882 RepID=UPI001B392417|nr:aminoglycoside phosphotransferase family protein [Micromonospora sp. C95]MBQ1025362.1 aminoglycoside phosphotransferase family protein [Micromonospora sp. C95]
MVEREILTGGGVNEVVRIGDTVRRPTGPWSARVHDLLRHLAARGFAAAPRVRDTSEPGFEILDFLPGEVSNYPPTPAAASVEALESAAALLRAYHDATAEYARRAPRDGWQVAATEPVEVICHGDYAPHNCVLDGNRVVGIIDFDHAQPGPRIWDVAYAAYRWVPMTAPENTDGFGTAEEQAARLRTFCDRYGLNDSGRAGLVDAAVARLHALVDFMHAQAAAGNAAFAGHLADGHHIQYLNDARYVRAQRLVFEHALGRGRSGDLRGEGRRRSEDRQPGHH